MEKENRNFKKSPYGRGGKSNIKKVRKIKFKKKAMITRVTMVGNGRKPRRCNVWGG
jgi:hypothetical protein